MKLRMAQNSLFAVLLRSPWWISLLIALAFVAGSRALLPDAYWAFGAVGGFPFVAIAGMAAWRQSKAPSPAQVDAVLHSVSALNWRGFAPLLEKGFLAQGYAVEPLDGSTGADFALRRSGRTTLVSARRWKAAQLGEDSVSALVQARQAGDASAAVLVALGGLSLPAQRLAKQQGVDLLQAGQLATLLRGQKLG